MYEDNQKTKINEWIKYMLYTYNRILLNEKIKDPEMCEIVCMTLDDMILIAADAEHYMISFTY